MSRHSWNGWGFKFKVNCVVCHVCCGVYTPGAINNNSSLNNRLNKLYAFLFSVQYLLSIYFEGMALVTKCTSNSYPKGQGKAVLAIYLTKMPFYLLYITNMR